MKYEIRTKYVLEGGEPAGDILIIDNVDSVDYESLDGFVQFKKGDLNKMAGADEVLLTINKYDVRSVRLITEDKNAASSE